MVDQEFNNGSELFQYRMDEFTSIRINQLNCSIRIKHKQMWKADLGQGEDYEDFLDSIIDNIKVTNAVAKQHAADEVLDYIKEGLIKHAKNHRDKDELLFSANIFNPMTVEADFLPWSNLHQFLPDQKHMLQLLGADIESQALVKFIDNQLLKMGKIAAGDVMDFGNDIYTMKESAFKAFNYLRIGRCG